MRYLKKLARIIVDILLLSYGLLYYFFNTSKPLQVRTPPQSFQSMIRLFCVTRGVSNDILSKVISFFDKPLRLPNYHGILGNLTSQEIQQVVRTLENEGYYIFERKLSPELIANLYNFASEQECTLRQLDGHEHAAIIKTRYDRNHLQSSVYDISSKTLIAHPQIQTLLCDHSLLGVAQQYLKTSPKIEPVVCWWSTPFSNQPQANAAQKYHFDMDRLKWLKIFIFLTDVTLESGPHVFVSKSHRTFGIPASLLKAGYARIDDTEVSKHYSLDDVKTFTVPAGTILAEDTRGLHKGTPLVQGERLVLEFQYSNCLFGGAISAIEDIAIEDLTVKAFMQEHRKIFDLYPA